MICMFGVGSADSIVWWWVKIGTRWCYWWFNGCTKDELMLLSFYEWGILSGLACPLSVNLIPPTGTTCASFFLTILVLSTTWFCLQNLSMGAHRSTTTISGLISYTCRTVIFLYLYSVIWGSIIANGFIFIIRSSLIFICFGFRYIYIFIFNIVFLVVFHPFFNCFSK